LPFLPFFHSFAACSPYDYYAGIFRWGVCFAVPVISPNLDTRRPLVAVQYILALASIIALLYFGRLVWITLLISIILAFLLEPMVGFFMKLKLPRAFASVIVCSIALLVLYLIALGVYSQIVRLAEDLPIYGEKINALVEAANKRVEDLEKSVSEVFVPRRFREQVQPPQPEPPPTRGRRRPAQETPPAPPPVPEVRIKEEPRPFLAFLYGYLSPFFDVLLMASFVPFLVYFMLSWRDHLRRQYFAMFEGPERDIASRIWHAIADMARAYVLGNFLLGVFLSVASSLFFAAINLPYWPVVGPLSGFLSLVPYLGLPLAIIPALFAALPAFDQPSTYFFLALTIGVLHLLALNLLYPKFVGSRVHLNPLAVTVALMLWGALWGGAGLLFAIPITAAIKAVCDNVSSLQAYGRLLGD
jgi:predicted PurR-regulated permease PerM